MERRFAPDEMLFWEGEPCAGIFLIVQGSVKIFRTSPGGREVMLAIETAPATVAELPLFDGGPYPASVRVVEPVVSLFINKTDFQQVCRQYPEVGLKVLAVVGRRLRHLVGLVESMTFGSVTQRLARLLLDASKGAGGENFELPVTHQELASRLGTVREVVAEYGAFPRRRADPHSRPPGADCKSRGARARGGVSGLKRKSPRKQNVVLEMNVQMKIALQRLKSLEKRPVCLTGVRWKLIILRNPANLVQ